MKLGLSSNKAVALSMRGFAVEPNQIESIVGVPASESGRLGEPVKPGVKAILKRSFIRYSLEFPNDFRLDEMIPVLLKHLGGVHNLKSVRERVMPEFFEVDLTLPIKWSEAQEGGFISGSTIEELGLLKATLSFQFI